jgi:C4-dicarboxylate-specific signal transduction histidine kinase
MQSRRIVGDRAIALHVAKPDAHVHTDPVLLEHILLNLIRNAVDAVDHSPSAEVRLEAAATGTGFEWTVRDNGPGIAPADWVKVREPFFTTKAFGTGLGLPITDRLTRALGGALTLAAGTPRGIAATVRIPAEHNNPSWNRS